MYSETNSKRLLSGLWSTNKTKEYNALTGTIKLELEKEYDSSKVIDKVKELNLDKTLSFLEQNQLGMTAATLDENVNKKVTENPNPDNKRIDVAINEKANIKNRLTMGIDSNRVSNSTKNVTAAAIVKKKEIEKLASPTPVIADNKRVSDSIKNVTAAAVVKKKEAQKPAILKPVIAGDKKRVSDSIKHVTAAAIVKKKEVEKALPKPEPTKSDIVKSPPVITKPPQIAASQLATRQIENIRNVSFKSDSLVISLYDNGEIDGDTVSVVLNGNIIIARQGLSTNAITKTIYPSQGYGDSLQLIMYAENLGSIPPNTGILILQDGDDRYEIRFAGDLQKNSSIILKRKE
jgi:hypothetical protein